MKPLISFFLFFSLCLSSFATIPSGYYTTLEGTKAEGLKTAAHLVIKVHDRLSYSNLWTTFEQTDCRPDDPTKICDMYSPYVTYFVDHSTLEKEHCVPNSWWGGPTVDNEVAYRDINNLFPADGSMNSSKSNYPLSIVGATTLDNGVSKSGTSVYPGYSGRAFEPADEYKGDFARTYFYMATCYQDYTWLSDATGQFMIINGAYPSLLPWAQNLLLEWSRQDPVSEKETTRNEKVYTLQLNRNPFIDYPDLAEYIWGNKTNVFFSSNPNPNPNPPTINIEGKLVTANALMNFSTTQLTRSYHIEGQHLEGDITIQKSGTNANQFSVSTTSISQANALAGQTITITYTPTISGTHNATLTLSSTNSNPFTIQLVGKN